jgi:hypothetical protein
MRTIQTNKETNLSDHNQSMIFSVGRIREAMALGGLFIHKHPKHSPKTA